MINKTEGIRKMKRITMNLASGLTFALTFTRIRKITVQINERIPPAPSFHQAKISPANPKNQKINVIICKMLNVSRSILPFL
jgi:hypothetical protein